MASVEFEQCARILHFGRELHLGELDGGGYAVWTPDGGGPRVIFPDGVGGWAAALDYWSRAEAPPRSAPSWIGPVVALVIIVIVYIGYHAYRYHHCLSQPGIFAWPSQCF